MGPHVSAGGEDWSLFDHPDLTPEEIDRAVERQRERIETRRLFDEAEARDARWSA